jgi:hypothetical protein
MEITPVGEDAVIDSYAEEIFLVNTADARNPVLIWPHDGDPTVIHDSFYPLIKRPIPRSNILSLDQMSYP